MQACTGPVVPASTGTGSGTGSIRLVQLQLQARGKRQGQAPGLRPGPGQGASLATWLHACAVGGRRRQPPHTETFGCLGQVAMQMLTRLAGIAAESGDLEKCSFMDNGSAVLSGGMYK
jgi:hypothetical protein